MVNVPKRQQPDQSAENSLRPPQGENPSHGISIFVFQLQDWFPDNNSTTCLTKLLKFNSFSPLNYLDSLVFGESVTYVAESWISGW